MLERVVCGKCSVSMYCTKNAKKVCYNDTVVFYGDEFTCPLCGAVIVPITSDSVPVSDVPNRNDCLNVRD